MVTAASAEHHHQLEAHHMVRNLSGFSHNASTDGFVRHAVLLVLLPVFWHGIEYRLTLRRSQIPIEPGLPFKKILCANRGEIAIRVFRAGTELGLRTVCNQFPQRDACAIHTVIMLSLQFFERPSPSSLFGGLAVARIYILVVLGRDWDSCCKQAAEYCLQPGFVDRLTRMLPLACSEKCACIALPSLLEAVSKPRHCCMQLLDNDGKIKFWQTRCKSSLHPLQCTSHQEDNAPPTIACLHCLLASLTYKLAANIAHQVRNRIQTAVPLPLPSGGCLLPG
jgi:hypothetical protein